MNTDYADQIVVPLVTGEHEMDFSSVSLGADNGIIGQEMVCRSLSFHMQTHSERTPFPTMLFTGSKGLGKTYIAGKLAKTMGRRFIDINCGTLNTESDLVEGLLFNQAMGTQPVTILLDEAHELPSDVITVLLSLLNVTPKHINKMIYKTWVIEYDFSKINIILATTDAHRIFSPLLDRCEPVYFNKYGTEELHDILQFYLKDITLGVKDKTDLALACRGRARQAFRLSEKIMRYCDMKHFSEFKDDDWGYLKDVLGIRKQGLTHQEVGLMKILQSHSPMSGRDMAVMMGVNVKNIESELEVRPKEMGFIESTSKGRCLTADGIAYLETL